MSFTTSTDISNFIQAATKAAGNTVLGLGTGDSPQFTAVNIGAATDTTLTRVSAGVIAVEGATVIVSAGALGTPASGTLTNCTGLPQAGTVGLTTADSPQFAGVNIGAATDTTITRVSAGVIAVEGVTVTTGTIASGGTNATSFANSNGVVIYDGTRLVASVASGATTQVLHGGASGAPTWGSVALGTSGDVSGTLMPGNGGTGNASYSVGDLLYASGATTLSKLADVAVGQILVSGGLTTAPAWSPNLSITGTLTTTTAARSSGNASFVTITTPADTGITTTTESIGFNKTASTRTWADGTTSLQREVVFGAPTYAKTTTSATFTTAINVDIADPIAATGVTFTNKYALRVASFDCTGAANLEGTTTAATINVTTANVTALNPVSNDGAPIGTTSLNWSDLFLATGAVINYNNGNVVLTHSSGILTMGTGELRVTTIGTNTASVVSVGGTQTLTAKTISSGNYTGPQILAEGASIQLDPAGSADGAYSGVTITGTSGYSQAFGDLVMLDPNQSPARWELASVSAAAGAVGDCRGLLAMVVVTGTDGNSCTLLLSGIIRADANFPTFTVNGAVYATTTGDVTNTQPSTTDHVIRIVGAAMTTDEIRFSPDGYWQTHT